MDIDAVSKTTDNERGVFLKTGNQFINTISSHNPLPFVFQQWPLLLDFRNQYFLLNIKVKEHPEFVSSARDNFYP